MNNGSKTILTWKGGHTEKELGELADSLISVFQDHRTDKDISYSIRAALFDIEHGAHKLREALDRKAEGK